MRSLAALVVLLAGCGPLTPPKMDGGAGGGGGAATGGGLATGGAGGGAATGGGGGGAADAGDGVWEFSSVTLNPAPANSGAIVGFAETDAGIFAVSGSGRVYRSTGGAFTELFAFPGLQPLDFEATASGHFFILSTVRFLECASNCADAGAWSNTQISASNEVLDSLCVVDGAHVLAVGGRGAADDGISYRWNGTSLATTAALLGVVSPQNCWRGATGDFFIPARDTVLRYAPGTESFTAEPTMTPMSGWRGGGSSPGHEWVSGNGPTIAERGQTSWATVYSPTGTGGAAIVSIIGISPTLAFAFGSGASSAGQTGYRFNGTSWSTMSPDLPVINQTASAFRASDGTIYVGGNDSNLYAVILRGARR